jgi:hypothetical protein
MKVGLNAIDELCYAAEGLSGTAAASSLRKLASIMERAPTGRLFGAISTLSDMSARTAEALEEASRALEKANHGEAAARITEALAGMDALAEEAVEPRRKRRMPRQKDAASRP